MHVTTAICTWNRSGLLRQTLESLTAVVRRDIEWEVLVVDNASTDDTADVVREFAARLPIRSVVEPARGLSNARNRALAEAQGEFLMFTDDDVLVDTHWIEAFVQSAAQQERAAVWGGPIEPWFATPVDDTLLEAFPSLKVGFCGIDHGPPERELDDSTYVFGANMAYRMTAIRDLEFDPNLGPNGNTSYDCDELDFIDRVRARGHRVVWVPQMRLRHYVPPDRMTLAYLQAYYRAKGETFVRYHGFTPGEPTLMGVPRWVLRRAAEEWLQCQACRITARRRDALVHLREYAKFRGMIDEARRQNAGSGVATA